MEELETMIDRQLSTISLLEAQVETLKMLEADAEGLDKIDIQDRIMEKEEQIIAKKHT